MNEHFLDLKEQRCRLIRLPKVMPGLTRKEKIPILAEFWNSKIKVKILEPSKQKEQATHKSKRIH